MNYILNYIHLNWKYLIIYFYTKFGRKDFEEKTFHLDSEWIQIVSSVKAVAVLKAAVGQGPQWQRPHVAQPVRRVLSREEHREPQGFFNGLPSELNSNSF